MVKIFFLPRKDILVSKIEINPRILAQKIKLVDKRGFLSKIYILYQILTFDILCLLTYVDEFLRNDLVCAKFGL